MPWRLTSLRLSWRGRVACWVPRVNGMSQTLFSCLCCCSEKNVESLGHIPPFVRDNVDSVTVGLGPGRLLWGLAEKSNKASLGGPFLLFVFKDVSLLWKPFQSCGDIHGVVSSSGRRRPNTSWTSDIKHTSGNAHFWELSWVLCCHFELVEREKCCWFLC